MEGKTPQLARIIKEKADNVNILQTYVQMENLERRNAIWSRLNKNHLQGFPKFGLNYLEQLTLGVYQLSLAPSYIQDKLYHDSI